jgi:hypothetical protein
MAPSIIFCRSCRNWLPAGLARLTRATIVASTTAAATASATSAPTTTAAKALSATTAASEAAAASGPVCLGLGFVDLQRTAAQFGAIQRCNSLLSFARVGHLDKRETPRASSLTISDDADVLHLPVGSKHFAQLTFCRAVGQVPHIKVLHLLLPFFCVVQIRSH